MMPQCRVGADSANKSSIGTTGWGGCFRCHNRWTKSIESPSSANVAAQKKQTCHSANSLVPKRHGRGVFLRAKHHHGGILDLPCIAQGSSQSINSSGSKWVLHKATTIKSASMVSPGRHRPGMLFQQVSRHGLTSHFMASSARIAARSNNAALARQNRSHRK